MYWPHGKWLWLTRTIYLRCIYSIFGREIPNTRLYTVYIQYFWQGNPKYTVVYGVYIYPKYTVVYGVYIRFWPTLQMPHTYPWTDMNGRCRPKNAARHRSKKSSILQHNSSVHPIEHLTIQVYCLIRLFKCMHVLS